MIEYRSIKPITAKNIVNKNFKWLFFLRFFLIAGSFENIVVNTPINIKIDIIRYTFFQTFWSYVSVPKKEANHRLPAPATNIAILYPAIYIEDKGPWSDWGEDSILNASIKISWVALKKAKIVMNKAVKNQLFWGSVNAVSIKATIIDIWDKKSQLFLWPNFF